ncbi:uncharacterized protein LOC142344076 [Convolutriloba macropyga]|uniref:uncharacterized protein LOC142344076 n=1 Tax=Convolutriloba macropyga TaxID=536237 RepID=UPI003F51CECD
MISQRLVRFALLAIFYSRFGLTNSKIQCPQQCTCTSVGASSYNNDIKMDCSPANFSKLPKILPLAQFVNFSTNSIKYLDESSFRGSQYLRKIDFSYNQIAQLGPEVFNGLPYLERVSLAYNKLTFLNWQVFHRSQNRENSRTFQNRNISLFGNPWHCNCPLEQVWTKLKSIDGLHFDAMICASPAKYKGKPIDQVYDLCEDKLSWHDWVIIILAIVCTVLSVILTFWGQIKSCVNKLRYGDSEKRDEYYDETDNYGERYDVYDNQEHQEGYNEFGYDSYQPVSRSNVYQNYSNEPDFSDARIRSNRNYDEQNLLRRDSSSSSKNRYNLEHEVKRPGSRPVTVQDSFSQAANNRIHIPDTVGRKVDVRQAPSSHSRPKSGFHETAI